MVASIVEQGVQLSRTVDGEGEALGVLIQRRRDRVAALEIFGNRLQKQGFTLAVIVTDKLGYCGAARRAIGFALGLRPRRRLQDMLFRASYRQFRPRPIPLVAAEAGRRSARRETEQ